MIGADATGLPFNSIMAILLENDHPSTPLVNAGVSDEDGRNIKETYVTKEYLFNLLGK